MQEKGIYVLTTSWVLIFFLTLLGCHNASNESNSPNASPPKASIIDVEKGIRSYINTKSQNNEGYFEITTDSQTLSLRLVRVHTEYLSVLGKGNYFACVDLADTKGDVYDVDFFLAGNPDSMTVTETTLHKLNGKPFYSWKQQEDKTWRRVPVNDSGNELLGVIEGVDTFTFNYQLVIPTTEDKGKLWVPYPQSDDFQQVELLNTQTPIEPTIVSETAHGNKAFFFSISPQHQRDTLTFTYRVIRKEKSAYAASEPLSKSLSSSTLLPTGGRFQAIADSVIKRKQANSDLEKARALYDYVIESVRYAKQGKYGTGDANYACDSKSGNCTEFHSLFISLARSAGVPARFAIGAAIPANRNEGGVNGYHCWAEFYAEGKWWPVDISEANKYTSLATYYFGHHPANRIELSRGRDLRFSPSSPAEPIPFFAYPVWETSQGFGKVKTLFSFHR